MRPQAENFCFYRVITYIAIVEAVATDLKSRGRKPYSVALFRGLFPLQSPSRDRLRFFDQVGQQTTNASIGNKHFSLNDDLVRLTKIMNNLIKDLKILSFSVSKIS